MKRRKRHFEPRPCIDCGGTFKPRSGAQRRCKPCAAKHKPTSPGPAELPARDCRRCAETFSPTHHKHTYCPTCRKVPYYERQKTMELRAGPDLLPEEETSAAKSGAAPGDFQPPTSNCRRCSAVVVLSRPAEYEVLRHYGKGGEQIARRELVCRRCAEENRQGKALATADSGAPELDARRRAVARCLELLLALDRDERRAAWLALSRAKEQLK